MVDGAHVLVGCTLRAWFAEPRDADAFADMCRRAGLLGVEVRDGAPPTDPPACRSCDDPATLCEDCASECPGCDQENRAVLCRDCAAAPIRAAVDAIREAADALDSARPEAFRS